MATAHATKPRNLPVDVDDYLTDGLRLARVYAVEADHVILEDAETEETQRVQKEELAVNWRRLKFERDTIGYPAAVLAAAPATEVE